MHDTFAASAAVAGAVTLMSLCVVLLRASSLGGCGPACCCEACGPCGRRLGLRGNGAYYSEAKRRRENEAMGLTLDGEEAPEDDDPAGSKFDASIAELNEDFQPRYDITEEDIE